MTRALDLMLLAGVALAARRWPSADTAPLSIRTELPARRCRRAVHRADQADRPAPVGHVRPRLPADLPRRRGAGRQRDRGSRGRRPGARAKRAAIGAADLPGRGKRDDRWRRRGAVASPAATKRPALDYRRYAVAARQDPLSGRRACRLRPGAARWRWRRSSPTGRRRARCRSRPPRSATRPPSPGSRPARSMPPGRGPKPIRATMAAASPRVAEFFESLAEPRRQASRRRLAEALANQGLQQSNLGNFAAAERLLAGAEAPAREATA